MFTGIIEEVGTVREADRGRLVIACQSCLTDTRLGDSIAINGVDLTVMHVDDKSLHFQCMPETYRRSNLGSLSLGESVNLECSLTLATGISGHLVRGVVEATGALLSLTPEEDALLARYSAPPDILRIPLSRGRSPWMGSPLRSSPGTRSRSPYRWFSTLRSTLISAFVSLARP